MAKLVNVWREQCNATIHTCAQECGAMSAHTHAHSLVPRCLAGRWGSVYKIGVRITAASEEGHLRRTLLALLGRVAARPEAEPGEAAAPHDIDELRVEAQQAYSQRMGRWRRDILAICLDEQEYFFRLVGVVTRTLAPSSTVS